MKMSITALRLLILWLLISLVSSCSSIIKGYVNKKYPPVSSVAKSTESVQQSISQMQNMPTADLGIKISRSFMDSLFYNYFAQLVLKDSTLGIPGVNKVEVVEYPKFSLGRQEIIVNTHLKFYIKNNKYLKTISISFSGRVSPAIIADSLILRPSFQSIKIVELKLTKCVLLGSAVKKAVNLLCSDLMDNINGQIKDLNLKINYPPIPEEPLSQILGDDANIKVKNDYVFKLKHQILTPVILIEPENILIISSIADGQDSVTARINAMAATSIVDKLPRPAYVINNAGEIKSIRHADSTQLKFNELYAYLDSSFKEIWATNLDSINYKDSVTQVVDIAYDAMSRITNELFRDVKFSLQYNLNFNQNFPMQEFQLKEIAKPDCSAITFNCPLNNCANVISDCGSCSWWNVPCHVAWTACQAFNGVKYAACQSANGAKLIACATELAARKALCYTEVAAIFIYDNLIRPVGYFSGNVAANGTIDGEIDATTLGGINSIGLTGKVQADINGAGSVFFAPAGALGLLVCNMPTAAAFNVNHAHISNPNFNINATINKQKDMAGPYLNVSMSKITLPIQLQQPFIDQILLNPQLILNCGIGILGGLTYLALKDNETFHKILDVAFKGSYNLDIQRDFNIHIPEVPIQMLQQKELLHPQWGNRSLVFSSFKN